MFILLYPHMATEVLVRMGKNAVGFSPNSGPRCLCFCLSLPQKANHRTSTFGIRPTIRPPLSCHLSHLLILHGPPIPGQLVLRETKASDPTSKGRAFPRCGKCAGSGSSFCPGIKRVLTVSFYFLLVKLLKKILCSSLWVRAWHHLLEIIQQFL